MGWSWGDKPHNVKQYLNDLHDDTVIESKIVSIRTYYAAVQREDGSVYASIILLDYAKSGHEFGYKGMTEFAGPYVVSCPISILDKLSETDNDNALEWRRRCRENVEAKAARRVTRASLKNGDRIEVYGHIYDVDALQYVRNGKQKTKLYLIRDGKRYAFSRAIIFKKVED